MKSSAWIIILSALIGGTGMFLAYQQIQSSRQKEELAIKSASLVRANDLATTQTAFSAEVIRLQTNMQALINTSGGSIPGIVFPKKPTSPGLPIPLPDTPKTSVMPTVVHDTVFKEDTIAIKQLDIKASEEERKFWAKVIFSAMVFIAALFVLLRPGGDPDAKKWAISALTTVAGVWIGTATT